MARSPNKSAKSPRLSPSLQLGRAVEWPATPQAAQIDRVPNPQKGTDYLVRFTVPEFTSICPVTGQPDFATITIVYVPNRLCVEMKSLKLYFFSFRNRGIFYEGVINEILDDLVAVLKPRRITVTGDFNVRGGTGATVTVSHPLKKAK